ncbi:hypothetical protein ACHAXS_001022, partial [Conticribra weissflogii]
MAVEEPSRTTMLDVRGGRRVLVLDEKMIKVSMWSECVRGWMDGYTPTIPYIPLDPIMERALSEFQQSVHHE